MNYDELVQLLKSEVRPAMGCTEPAAIAFTVASAREMLKGTVLKVKVYLSSNVFKNAMAVNIPSIGEAGPVIAAAIGAVKGESKDQLRIFSNLNEKDIEQVHKMVASGQVDVNSVEKSGLYIEAEVTDESETAIVTVNGGHTEITKKVLNGTLVYEKTLSDENMFEKVDLKKYKISDLVEAISKISLSKISFLEQGIEMNMSIAEQGLKIGPGLGVGAGLNSILKNGVFQNDLVCKVRMAVAAACDARMSGLELPVMSTMGSGNQGIVASIPVVVVGREANVGREKVLRALALSHLVTAYVKQHVGKLSPMCGCAIAAGAGATAAITWLLGGDSTKVCGSVQNIIGDLSGMICDGAKGGCALKLSTSGAEAVIMAQLALNNVVIKPSDGIISFSVEETVQNLAKLGISGMSKTDNVILDIMMSKEQIA